MTHQSGERLMEDFRRIIETWNTNAAPSRKNCVEHATSVTLMNVCLSVCMSMHTKSLQESFPCCYFPKMVRMLRVC